MQSASDSIIPVPGRQWMNVMAGPVVSQMYASDGLSVSVAEYGEYQARPLW